MQTIHTEALVIGSGFGAAAPALRMVQAGMEVLMIEKGPDIKPSRDFEQTTDPKYYLKYLKSFGSNTVGFTYAEGLGGGSGFYEMVSLRAPSKVFNQTDHNGTRLWPGLIDRAELDKYYDIAEKMIHVEQIAENEIPKSGVAFSNMMKNLGYSCDRARYAVKGCVGSGYCVSGCVFGAKQSLHLNYLPKSIKLGMKVMTGLEAVSIKPTRFEEDYEGTKRENEKYRYRVLCRNKETHEDLVIYARIIVMGGGTIGIAITLLRSQTDMPFLSKHVGKNICINGSVKAAGILPEGFIEGDMLSGRSHPGMISYQFLESHGITVSAVKPLPLDVMSSAHLLLENDTRDPKTWGEPAVEVMKLYRRRMMILIALGLTPPSARIKQTGRDSFEPDMKITHELEEYYHQSKELLHSIFRGNGCRIVQPQYVNGEGQEYNGLRFSTTHMIGSCRMADSKENGVCDENGEVFGYPGLYIADGAAVPTSLAVNSSLTILANAERIGTYIAHRYGRQPVTLNEDLYNIEIPLSK